MTISKTPAPPYYVVIFTSELRDDTTGYEEMAKKMVELSSQYPGFLGIDSARSEVGITVCYWKNEADILNWKSNFEHLEAQRLGKEKWYKRFELRIGRVERAYGFESGEN